MKNRIFYIGVAVISLVIVSIFVVTKLTPETAQEEVVDASDYVIAHNQVGNLPLQALSDDEKNGLIKMREEEKLAHDVYLTLYDKWGINQFRNIASSESTHTESVRYLLERYGIDDPVKDQTVGVFANERFTNLYNDLVEKGEVSLTDALIVGATIEDLDLMDLQELADQTDNNDIKSVYNNLMRGSRNHLRAFSRQLSRSGVSYSAQFLSQTEVDEILSSGQERGW